MSQWAGSKCPLSSLKKKTFPGKLPISAPAAPHRLWRAGWHFSRRAPDLWPDPQASLGFRISGVLGTPWGNIRGICGLCRENGSYYVGLRV